MNMLGIPLMRLGDSAGAKEGWASDRIGDRVPMMSRPVREAKAEPTYLQLPLELVQLLPKIRSELRHVGQLVRAHRRVL